MATDPRLEGLSDDEIKEGLPLVGHLNKPARNLGVSDPAGDKSETPTKPLPPVQGNQATERVQVGGDPEPVPSPQERAEGEGEEPTNPED